MKAALHISIGDKTEAATKEDALIAGKLLNAEQLLESLFTKESRPSLRWLRSQTRARAIPFVRLGHFVLFDLELVRRALANRNLVKGRWL
jgi:hypothetical protein